MSKINADYDSSLIQVNPDGLNMKAKTLESLAQDVQTSLVNIEHALASLQLGWAGKTASEAKDFQGRWDTAMRELFGSDDHPETGVLNAIVDGVLTVQANFAIAETALVSFFNEFGQGLSGGGDTPTPTSPPPNIDDVQITAITEIW